MTSSAGKTTQTGKVQIGYFAGLEGLQCTGSEALLGWCKQGFLPTVNSLTGVKMVNAKVGWAVGAKGTILRTQDGGSNWVTQSLTLPANTQTAPTVQGVDAIDENTAWVVGEYGFIAKTTDGGKTWQSLASGTSESLSRIVAVDANILWANNSYVMLRSEDGGKTWVKLSLGNNAYYPYLSGAVSAPSASVAWVTSSSYGTFRTEDGGKSWKQVSTLRGYALKALDTKTAWLVDSYYSTAIKRTTDGGVTWVNLPVAVPGKPSSYGYYREIHALDANNVFLLDSDGYIVRSQDAGATWTNLTPIDRKPIYAMSLFDANNAVAVGSYGTVFAMQGGKPWASANRGLINTSSYYGTLSPVVALNANEALIPMGYDLHATSDGGLTWKKSTGACIRALQKMGASSLLGMGCNSGTFVKSTDKGVTWTTLNISVNGQYWTPTNIAVVSDKVAWAVGSVYVYNQSSGAYQYTAARSVDGGITWEVLPTGSTTALSLVAAADEKAAWVTSSNGTIYGTQDGGKTWALQTSGSSGTVITSIKAFNAQNAWATSSTKSVIGTKDGGATWVVQDTSASNVMLAVDTLDGKVVWAVGEKGRILRSADSGASWSEQTSGVTDTLRNITLIDNNTAWVTGDNSTMLKTATGGK